MGKCNEETLWAAGLEIKEQQQQAKERRVATKIKLEPIKLENIELRIIEQSVKK